MVTRLYYIIDHFEIFAGLRPGQRRFEHEPMSYYRIGESTRTITHHNYLQGQFVYEPNQAREPVTGLELSL